MVVINLFQIPDFLKKTQLGIELLKYSNSLDVGSEEWIAKMSTTIEIQNIIFTDEIKNANDFIKVLRAFSFWSRDKFRLPVSAYIYYFENSEECIEIIGKAYLEKANLTLDDLKDEYMKDYPKDDNYNGLHYGYVSHFIEKIVIILMQVFIVIV